MKLCQTKNSMCTSPNKHATRNEKYANIVSAEVKRKKTQPNSQRTFSDTRLWQQKDMFKC